MNTLRGELTIEFITVGPETETHNERLRNRKMDARMHLCDQFISLAISVLLSFVLILCSFPVAFVYAAPKKEPNKPVSIEAIALDQDSAENITPLQLDANLEEDTSSLIPVPEMASQQRTIEVEVLDTSQYTGGGNEIRGPNLFQTEPAPRLADGIRGEYIYTITQEEREILTRVVEAEVTGIQYRYNGVDVSEEQMLISKIIVAQVFLNRVFDTDKFSHITTIKDAVFENNATSTIKDGRYYEVDITDLSKEAVELALLDSTPDYSEGGLFFSSGTTECKYGEYLFTDNVGHSVFK